MILPKPGDIVYEAIGWGDRAALEVLHVYENKSILVHEPGFPGDFIESYLSYDAKKIGSDSKVRRIMSWEVWDEQEKCFVYVC